MARDPTAVSAADAERPLLAVRQFRSLSPDPRQSYFAAGMTEEIRGQLSQISALRLLSRNGLDAYRDDATRAVRELGLRHLVDGSVRVDGNRVRVSAELVDASTQQTLWSDRYDCDLADVLTVQSQIAQQIARALHASLSPAEQLPDREAPDQQPRGLLAVSSGPAGQHFTIARAISRRWSSCGRRWRWTPSSPWREATSHTA